MSDEEKREDIQVWGEDRDKALAACRQTIAAWGLTMPEVEVTMSARARRSRRASGWMTTFALGCFRLASSSSSMTMSSWT